MFPNILSRINNFLSNFQTMSSSSSTADSTTNTNTFNINSTSGTLTHSGQVEWSDDQTAALIEQRRSRNFEYHYQIPGRSRKTFWNSVAEKVNEKCGCSYSGKQCQTKFNGLVTSYHVS
jgi:Myb/SANT-like DNA-binding domain